MLLAHPHSTLDIDWTEDVGVSFYYQGLYLYDPEIGNKGYDIYDTVEGINLYEISGDVAYRLKNSVSGQVVGFDDTFANISSHPFFVLDQPIEDDNYSFWFPLDFSIYRDTSLISSNYLDSWILELGVWNGYGDWTEPTSYDFYSTKDLYVLGFIETSFAPSDINLSAVNFDADIEAGSVVATISSDPGEHERHYYFLDNSFGDSRLFEIVDNQLTVRETPGAEFEAKDAYTIKIGLSDSHSRRYEEEFLLTVDDTSNPDLNIINSVVGKGKLKGTKEADQFTFNQFESFGKQTADKIIRFDSSQGDKIGVSAEAFFLLLGADEITFASASTKAELKQLKKGHYNVVYFEKNGRLFLNGNSENKGWGSSDQGGRLAILKGAPLLSVDDFTLLA